MKPSFWSFRMFGALWGILLAPLVPAAAAPPDPATLALPDSPVFVGWSHVISDENARLLKAIPPLSRIFDADELDVQKITKVIDLITLAGQGTGALGLNPAPTADGGEPTVYLVVDAGPAADGLHSAIHGLFAAAGELEQVSVAGQTFTRGASSDSGAADGPLWATIDGKFVLAGAQPDAEALVALLSGSDESLAQNPRFAAARDGLTGDAAGDWSFSLFVDVAALLAKVGGAGDSDSDSTVSTVLQALGVRGIESAYLRSAASSDGAITRVKVRTSGSRTGILKLWDQRPLTNDDLAFVPKDAYWAFVQNWDLNLTWAEARRVVEVIDPNTAIQLDGALAAVSATVGFSPTDDVLPALGDTWILYDAPDNGSYLFSGAVLIAEANQPDALVAAFQRVIEIVNAMLAQKGVKLLTKKVTHRGHEIHYLVVPGWPIPVAPAAAFVGDRVVCALTPQPVKLAIEQADPTLRKSSILDHPDVARLHDRLPSDMLSFNYADTRYMLGQMYQVLHLAKTALASVSMIEDDGIDPGMLPTRPEMLEHTHNVVTTCRATPDALLYESHGNAPLADMLSMPVATVALLVSILLPSLSRARELAKRAVSSSNLRQIGLGLYIYAKENDDKFPESLQILIERGEITPDTLTSPRLPAEFERASYVYIRGVSLRGAAELGPFQTIVAYEQVFGDEGTNVLFVDGHVEWMKLGSFKERLLATYRGLGREDEMPADLRP